MQRIVRTTAMPMGKRCMSSFVLPSMDFDYGALEPVISAEIMQVTLLCGFLSMIYIFIVVLKTCL